VRPVARSRASDVPDGVRCDGGDGVAAPAAGRARAAAPRVGARRAAVDAIERGVSAPLSPLQKTAAATGGVAAAVVSNFRFQISKLQTATAQVANFTWKSPRSAPLLETKLLNAD